MEIRNLNLRDWMDEAECLGTFERLGYDFVPDAESAVTLNAARMRFCNVCPVRDECLVTALRSGWKGYWGGTLTSERDKLRSLKRRVKCPLCKCVTLITAERSQICVACSRSWAISDLPSAEPQEVKIMGELL